MFLNFVKPHIHEVGTEFNRIEFFSPWRKPAHLSSFNFGEILIEHHMILPALVSHESAWCPVNCGTKGSCDMVVFGVEKAFFRRGSSPIRQNPCGRSVLIADVTVVLSDEMVGGDTDGSKLQERGAIQSGRRRFYTAVA